MFEYLNIICLYNIYHIFAYMAPTSSVCLALQFIFIILGCHAFIIASRLGNSDITHVSIIALQF